MRKKPECIDVGGIKFSKDVDIDSIKALGDQANPEFDAALRAPTKIRITTMVDEDIYHELKRLALQAGHGKYQTFLNDFLRQHLISMAGGRPGLEGFVKDLAVKIEKIANTQKALEKLVNTAMAEQPQKKKKRDVSKKEPARKRA